MRKINSKYLVEGRFLDILFIMSVILVFCISGRGYFYFILFTGFIYAVISISWQMYLNFNGVNREYFKNYYSRITWIVFAILYLLLMFKELFKNDSLVLGLGLLVLLFYIMYQIVYLVQEYKLELKIKKEQKKRIDK